jgi:uncharacterized protein YcbX
MASIIVGTIEEIWIYPVSSLGGQRLNSAELALRGTSGDRSWCIVDAETGVPASPEREPRWRGALFLKSRYSAGLPSIGFPDGEWYAVDDERLKAKLEAHFSFTVAVRPYTANDIDEQSGLIVANNRYEPSPVHLVTTSSLDHISGLMGKESTDARRFRPTILVRTAANHGFVEQSWIGRKLLVGAAVLQATEETKRCGMTLIAQPGLSEDPEVLRTVVRHNRRNLGIYCDVITPRTLEIGSVVGLLDQT